MTFSVGMNRDAKGGAQVEQMAAAAATAAGPDGARDRALVAGLEPILERAAADGRDCLLEHEVYQFLEAAGCRVPAWFFVPTDRSPTREQVALIGGAPKEAGGGGAAPTRVVLKVVSPQIAHKSDVGGVEMLDLDTADSLVALDSAVKGMLERVPARYADWLEEARGKGHSLPERYADLEGEALLGAIRDDIKGILVVERVSTVGRGPGNEVLVALQHNREFGPVLSMGVGGVDTEMFGSACREGVSVVSGSVLSATPADLLGLFRGTMAFKRLRGLTRGGVPLVAEEEIVQVVESFAKVGRLMSREAPAGDLPTGSVPPRWTITELEVNPFGATTEGLVALDGLLRFRPRTALPARRPPFSLGMMLKPRSMGIIGVSARGMNMGRIILRNILETGFPADQIHVVRPGADEPIDGVACVPRVEDLPGRVDLFVVAVSADQVPDLMEDLVEHDKATGVILIPGGMGEKEGGDAIEDKIRDTIQRGRSEGSTLVANGGNCLGIVSRPGRYHTLFVPTTKLPLPTKGQGNVAFISQSGAYMISRMSKLAWLSPRYAVSTGNQVDLTISDFLLELQKDPEVTTFGVYVEGFKDGDGLEFARAVQEVTASGKDVIFYKAGRTVEGKAATSGHTASLAGDYQVCAEVVRQAGAHVTGDFDQFLDLLKLSSLMGSRQWTGNRLAALSNAGYEAVGIADNLRRDKWNLQMAKLAEDTGERLGAALAKGRLDGLVDVRNPLDLTPMADDAAHEEAVQAFLEDPGVDMVLCATIPLTPTMATLADGVPEEQSIRSSGSLANRLPRLAAATGKPLVVSIDSGPLYDPMAAALEAGGIPTFRSSDTAVRTLGLYLAGRRNREA